MKQPFGVAVDIWSLGVVLYALLTTQYPFAPTTNLVRTPSGWHRGMSVGVGMGVGVEVGLFGAPSPITRIRLPPPHPYPLLLLLSET